MAELVEVTHSDTRLDCEALLALLDPADQAPFTGSGSSLQEQYAWALAAIRTVGEGLVKGDAESSWNRFDSFKRHHSMLCIQPGLIGHFQPKSAIDVLTEELVDLINRTETRADLCFLDHFATLASKKEFWVIYGTVQFARIVMKHSLQGQESGEESNHDREAANLGECAPRQSANPHPEPDFSFERLWGIIGPSFREGRQEPIHRDSEPDFSFERLWGIIGPSFREGRQEPIHRDSKLQQ